jgi:hypothetical protein
MTIFEQSNEFNSTCILSLDIVDEIIKKHSIPIMDLKVCMLLMKYKIYHFYFICIKKIIIIMGNMTKTLHNNEVCHEKLIVQSNGLQDNTKIYNLKN